MSKAMAGLRGQGALKTYGNWVEIMCRSRANWASGDVASFCAQLLSGDWDEDDRSLECRNWE